MKRFALPALLCASSIAVAQDPGDQEIPKVVYPAIVKAAATHAGFIPEGWKQVQLAKGDLNRDGKSDFAMVMRMNSGKNRIAPSWNPGRLYDTNPWMLIAVFRKGAGYELVLSDHQLIPRHENPNAEDEFDEVKIANGNLKVTMHVFLEAGGWQTGGTTYTFRWQDGGFKMIGFDRDRTMRNSGEMTEVSINYLTGRKTLKTGAIEDDLQTVTETEIAKKPLIDLTSIDDGLMFDPEHQ